MSYRRYCIASMAIVLSLATTSKATTIRNATTGQLLFADDYENRGTNVSHTTYLDPSGDYDPVAKVGTWNITGGSLYVDVPNGYPDEAVESDVQVTDHMSDVTPGTGDWPGAFHGRNYLRIDRAGANTSAIATMSTPMTVASNLEHILRFETMIAMPPSNMVGSNGATGGGNTASFGFSLVDSASVPTGGTTSITLPLFDDDGTLDNRINLQPSGNQIKNTNLMHSNGAAWDHFVLEYAIGSNVYHMWLNGNQASVDGNFDLPIASQNFVPTEIVGMRFTAGARTGGGGTAMTQAYLDSVGFVPEPSTFVITTLVLGCATLLGFRKRFR